MARNNAKHRMVLSPQARTELETILGARYVTDDPALLSGYAWNTGVGKIPGGDKFVPIWPIAVVLPATTEEVAAVIKCCKRHGLSFRPHSTGYGSMGCVTSPDSICIDLRRMNHLEILPEDRMAVIGPYATANQLQAEARKHGLTCHVVGAGPAHSPLASATSLIGVGITSQFTSANMRNMLAWEWVTPEGEIIRGGSAASGMGWYASDGPGPGTRGLLRGFFGGGGGIGVFTRIGIKLFPINHQGKMETLGQVPQLRSPLPPNTALLHAIFPGYDAQRSATFDLLQDDVCTVLLRMPPNHVGWTLTESNAEFVRRTRDGTLPEPARPENGASWTILIASRSAAEHQWRHDTVREIVARHGGRFATMTPEEEGVLYHNLATSQYVPRVLRASGGITTSFGVLDSFHFLPKAVEMGEMMLAKDTAPGGDLCEGNPDEQWIWPHEGRYMWAENIIHFDATNEASRAAGARALIGHFAAQWKDPVGMTGLLVGPIQDVTGPRIGKAPAFARKVKTYFDKDDRSKTKEYVIPNMPPVVEKILPAFRPVFSSAPVLHILSKMVGKNGT
ncbi:FAD-binding oxidoreductase [Rhizobium sp. SL86]|uniref:FAD-binding oxidoreductase n=1 Tax=Rhizobium sp. SL86 TaxID=2995148 RepID=UPI00227548B8|nr:FAD-binding oxidoreductase [Rhizobium sp. SL86]MCY1666312.1 FAD-binding oxidoreductase [Rhizobium sp. SL86]